MIQYENHCEYKLNMARDYEEDSKGQRNQLENWNRIVPSVALKLR